MMSFSIDDSPREILLGYLAATTLEILAAEFAKIALGGATRLCFDDELEAHGERVAERIPPLCHELIKQIRAYEEYERRRREQEETIDDIPF